MSDKWTYHKGPIKIGDTAWGYVGQILPGGQLTVKKVMKRWTGHGWTVIENPTDGASEGGGEFNEFGEVTP